MTAMKFTRPNLVIVLENADIPVIMSADDRYPLPDEVAGIVPHTPLFYVRLEGEGEMIPFFARVSDVVWNNFTRGDMEFECDMDGDRVRMFITEVKTDRHD